MTERPHIKPPLHGERFWRYEFRRLRRAHRQIMRAAERTAMSFDDAIAAIRQLVELSFIETGELPEEEEVSDPTPSVTTKTHLIPPMWAEAVRRHEAERREISPLRVYLLEHPASPLNELDDWEDA